MAGYKHFRMNWPGNGTVGGEAIILTDFLTVSTISLSTIPNIDLLSIVITPPPSPVMRSTPAASITHQIHLPAAMLHSRDKFYHYPTLLLHGNTNEIGWYFSALL